MASGGSNEWIILIPDKAESLEKRMSVRDVHIQEVKKHIDSGLFQMGGATLSQPPIDEKLDILGSAIIARAGTLDEVIKVLKQDIYYQTGVWDWDKMQVYPFKCVYRNGLEG